MRERPVLRRRPGARARTALTLALAVGGVAVTGCTSSSGSPGPTPSGTSVGTRPFTVMSTDPIRVADPAAVADAGSTVLSLAAFQRLLTAEPGEDALKPDAARDCLFTASTTYTCTLNKKLFFSNGDPVTSADVKFSIERAARLDVAGSSASLLSSLRRVETPDPSTVRFVLSRTDTQFGWALASPSASIVDAKVYDADQVRSPRLPVVGSGPFSVTSFDGRDLLLASNRRYVGRNPARTAVVLYRTAASSAAVEQAMDHGQVDVVWRGLNAAAVTRLSQQAGQDPDGQTADGFRLRTLTGLRVRVLQWAPTSSRRRDPALRRAVETALRQDRTLTSVVPGGVPGHLSTFAVGGQGRPKVTWTHRIRLDLGYDPTAPDARDVVTQIRTRLEDTGGLSVRLRADPSSPDLQLVDRKAWTATPLAWLQPYLAAPLPASRATVTRLESAYRSTTDEAVALNDLAALQKQAATDSTVLPVSQGDEYLFARDGVDVNENSFGPGWQLGLYGIKAG